MPEVTRLTSQAATFILVHLLKFVAVNAHQGVRRADPMQAGPLAVEAEIALVGFGFFRHDVQSGAAMADHRRTTILHRRTGRRRRRFAADATLLHHMDKAFIAADGAVRADVGAGGVFTLTAGGRRKTLTLIT